VRRNVVSRCVCALAVRCRRPACTCASRLYVAVAGVPCACVYRVLPDRELPVRVCAGPGELELAREIKRPSGRPGRHGAASGRLSPGKLSCAPLFLLRPFERERASES